MKEVVHSQIDRSNMLLVTLPVSGEKFWVQKPDNYVDPVEVARAEMPQVQGAIAGQNQCTHCGQGFNSANVLRDHILARHPVASGQADMALVKMPDGSMVPAAAVPELMTQRQDDLVAEHTEREKVLEAKLEDMATQLAALQQE